MTIDPLSDWWVHTVTVTPKTGDGPEGATYGNPYAIACFVDDRRRIILGPAGEQIVSETTIYAPTATPNVPLDSVVAIGAPHPAQSATVVGFSRHDGGGLPTPDHVEILLGG